MRKNVKKTQNSPAKEDQETRKIKRWDKNKKARDERERDRKQRERKKKRYREQSDAEQRKK